jgi:DNA-binding MarR family transcriptional regulator
MDTNTTRLVQIISSCGHRLNALGRSVGATTSRGGAWGLMKSLQQGGPQTIPGLARSRPVSRQHIRQLAQTLISQEWIESMPNPDHKRSFLLRLTAAGEQAANTMDAQIDSLLSECLHDVSPGELETTFKTLSLLADRLQLRLT